MAVQRAIEKLQALGDQLPFPHQSAVQGASPLRELRARGGRSRWRCIYVRRGDEFVILAIVPEAGIDRPGFERGVAVAKRRLSVMEEDP